MRNCARIQSNHVIEQVVGPGEAVIAADLTIDKLLFEVDGNTVSVFYVSVICLELY